MGALRKAGVWLGLVEEDDERAYDDDGGYDKGGYRDSRYRQSRYAEEFADEDDDADEEPPVPRAAPGDRGRLTERPRVAPAEVDRADGERSERAERAERASVRSITRSGAGESSGGADLPHPGQPGPGAAGPAARAGGGCPRRSSGTRSPRCTRPRTARRAPSGSTSGTAFR